MYGRKLSYGLLPVPRVCIMTNVYPASTNAELSDTHFSMYSALNSSVAA